MAAMVVQSFAEDPKSWADFSRFVELLGGDPSRGSLSKVRTCGSTELYLGWAQCAPAGDAQAAQSV
jgi:hypothetical protein